MNKFLQLKTIFGPFDEGGKSGPFSTAERADKTIAAITTIYIHMIVFIGSGGASDLDRLPEQQ